MDSSTRPSASLGMTWWRVGHDRRAGMLSRPRPREHRLCLSSRPMTRRRQLFLSSRPRERSDRVEGSIRLGRWPRSGQAWVGAYGGALAQAAPQIPRHFVPRDEILAWLPRRARHHVIPSEDAERPTRNLGGWRGILNLEFSILNSHPPTKRGCWGIKN